MENETEIKKIEKRCPNCNKPMELINSWFMEARAKRGPRLHISICKCDCGVKRVVEKEVK